MMVRFIFHCKVSFHGETFDVQSSVIAERMDYAHAHVLEVFRKALPDWADNMRVILIEVSDAVQVAR